jgi:hypothetical protein
LVGLSGQAQVNHHGPPCGGMGIYDVGVHIKGYEVLDYFGIRYSEISADSLRKGFTLALTDTTYKLSWFLIVYGTLDGVKEYSISGNRAILKNASFLKKIKAGDSLSLECINIDREGYTSLSTSFQVNVTK